MWMGNSFKVIANSHVSDDNPYWMSFSDIMAGLLVVFILACAILLLQLIEMKDKIKINITELHIANLIRREMLEEIAKKLKEQGIIVEVSDNHTIIRIPEQQLYFKTNSYELLETHRKTVSNIGKILYDSISQEQRLKMLDTIFIEGHTDSQRANRFIMGNWGLSSFRAITIWNFWTENTDYGESLKNLRNKENKPLFSVSGYADSRRLIDIEETDEQRRCNRRIDIRFTTRQPTVLQYEGVLDIFEGDR
jgi:flagellar motor protein MotB